MKDILKTGLILLVICVIAALGLGLTNEVTKGPIAEQRFLANEQAKKEVLPDAASYADITGEDLESIVSQFNPVTEAYMGLDASGNTIGYVFKSTPTGFGGNVEVVTGISNDGTVTGLRVGSHNETPGLGAKAKDADFYEQYAGKSALDQIGVSKTSSDGNDIQAITGATISSAAITNGANASIDAFNWIIENGGLEN
ncbi:RnfABCDGE type electron transport complex subunit G [Fusibacter bizertensis]|uniref:Ion-translocating oxidoreductase complex subunit G n=1 Tax=Fusibacter bizertensis TaxID=1488331 RepID=A0ABT6ND53_9FIRM|nr:RnfABCDGE type electron transport complex subunit G [Fusibacter bizertensis]MDH8678349.1 RnfABCDGE type electron transport complex subunit G [Fusibacter bizertensis]